MASAAVCHPIATASTSLTSSPLAASRIRVIDAVPAIVSVAPQVGYGRLKGVGLRSNSKATGLWNCLSWVRSEQRGGEAGFGVGASGRNVEQSLGQNGDLRSTSTKESALILIRHGESLWNSKNLFTGCVDVPLSQKGVEEAIEAGKRISELPVDMIFTSALIRAQMTAMLAMTQHHRQKVPVILHNESERAEAWSAIFSEDTDEEVIPVVTAWQLNERMYGELQGLNKKETADKFGEDKVREWRRSYDIPPPNGESLEMCAERAVKYFVEMVVPELASGKNIMIAAHGNSLRSIIMYLDKLTSQEVIELELTTGIPMLYTFKDTKFHRRGSPVGPTVAGVYALTKELAQYRDQSNPLNDTSQD